MTPAETRIPLDAAGERFLTVRRREVSRGEWVVEVQRQRIHRSEHGEARVGLSAKLVLSDGEGCALLAWLERRP